MDVTQYVVFEICQACNLGSSHAKCPNQNPERYAKTLSRDPLSDDEIVHAAVALYRDFGFRGMIGWHYYNEPLLARERMLSLMDRIEKEDPRARFILWTNGTQFEKTDDIENRFAQVHVTDYGIGAPVNALKGKTKSLTVHKWQLDERASGKNNASANPCYRMFSELCFDHFGNLHLCCIDWRGDHLVGNLRIDGLSELVSRWVAIRSDVSAKQMRDSSPDVCRKCAFRLHRVSRLVPEIAHDAIKKINMIEPEKKDVKMLSIAVISDGVAALDDEWEQHHSAFADIKCVKTHDAAEEHLRKRNPFSVALHHGEWLHGDVASALALHPNENVLHIPETDINIIATNVLGGISANGRATLSPLSKMRKVIMRELSVDTPSPSRLGVVFVSYRIPEDRLRNHFKWNDTLYRESNASVFVVTDEPHEGLPEYVRELIYPMDMKIFNLSATSNYGIRLAIESGMTTIIKTDVDMVYSDGCWNALTSVTPGRAVAPIYHMADDYETRETKFILAPKATGTVSQSAECWRNAHMDERCEGYGCDDAILLDAITRAKYKIVRTPDPIYHIAHESGTPQKEFNKAAPRVDHWGRSSEFNPENFTGNRQYHKSAYDSPVWGLAGGEDACIIVVAYRIPEARIRKWVEWNHELFSEKGLRAILVTDRSIRNIPEWLRVAIYPRKLIEFSLSKTSNYGIRLAGQGIICKTDIDVVFSEKALDAILRVTPKRGISPLYRMAQSYETRDIGNTWDASKGTIALAWPHWCDVRGYDERMSRYGVEDGDCYHRAGMFDGRKISRDGIVSHIDHSGNVNILGQPRPDIHNGDEFNARNHQHNRAVQRKGLWHLAKGSEFWGIA